MHATVWTFMLGRVVFQDSLGARIAGGAAAVLAAVLLWHFASRIREGRVRHWTGWSAGVLGGLTIVWLVGLITSDGFDSPWTQIVLLALLAVGTVLIFYHTVFHYLGAVRVSLLLLLRCLAIVVLVLLLFKPAIGHRSGAGDRPILAILVDRSQSMNEPDGPGRQMRLTAAVDAILHQQEKAEQWYDVRYFVFDSGLEKIDRAGQLTTIKPDGPGTHIDTALGQVRSVLADRRAEAAILFSDGIQNGDRSAARAAAELPRPLYAVSVGGPIAKDAAGKDVIRDVSLESVNAPAQAFRGNVVPIRLDLRSEGYAGQSASVVLRRDGQEVATQQVELTDGTQEVNLEFTPNQTGVSELQAEIMPLKGEAVAANNRHDFAVRVGDPQIKVLYVEGRPREEYKFLRLQLLADQHVELMSLVQIRRTDAGGAVFMVNGSVGDKRLDGFPTTADQFALFDVFIIGDLDRSYISDGQMKLLQEAVAKKGKGLLMIGGSFGLGPGGYGGTVIEDMLPVRLGGRTVGQENVPFQLTLTQAGKAHDIFRGLVDYISPPPDKPASQLPALRGCVKVLGLKASSNAQVLAIHPTRKTPDGREFLPVLAVQQYDAGRTAVFTADSTWQWYMFRTVAAYEGVYSRFWGQFVRWLASSELIDRKQAPAALLQLGRSYFAPDQTVELVARAWGGDGEPASGAYVTVDIADPDGKSRTLTLHERAGEPGVYAVDFSPQRVGQFALTLNARYEGVAIAREQRTVEFGRLGDEATRRSADPELMKEMAGASPASGHTQYIQLDKEGNAYAQLIEELTSAHRRRAEAGGRERTWPTYDTPLYTFAMLAFISLLSVEWLLRRRWQLQ
ncbi:MAG: hypothetical protein BIFFINMI_01888 [Phycisphaerae bacterium]|nr:hypothetical protein [Phycisphaerae bacterium]